MAYRNGNYSAFYVSEPFAESNLGAAATRDFNTYNLFRAWKKANENFPFNDSHDKNYNVRDGSDWENTLKPRLHDRLRNSKNIILILSSVTQNSRALREEIDYGINTCGLPVIVVYPEFKEKEDIAKDNRITQKVKNMWEKLPVFRNSLDKVPTIHVPYKKDLIKKALEDSDFMVNTKGESKIYFFK